MIFFSKIHEFIIQIMRDIIRFLTRIVMCISGTIVCIGTVMSIGAIMDMCSIVSGIMGDGLIGVLMLIGVHAVNTGMGGLIGSRLI